MHHLVVKHVHVVMDGAAIGTQAFVATAAEADIKMRQLDEFARSTLMTGSLQNGAQKRCSAFAGAMATVDGQNVHSRLLMAYVTLQPHPCIRPEPNACDRTPVPL